MFLLFFILLTCSTANHVYFQGTELLSDVNYTQGFNIIPACPPDPICTKAPRARIYNPFSTEPNKTASWQIAQWNSHSNLSTNGTIIDDGKSKGIQWSTEDKRFILFQDGRLQFAVNGFHEYGGKYRSPDDPWVHLLIQQNIGTVGGAVALSQVTELRVNLDIQLLYMDQHIQPGYHPRFYAGIFPIYMIIQNFIQGDPEYGKYFWLGLCSYDDRVLMNPLYINGDKGTGALIYSPAFENFSNISVHSEQIVHVTGDLIPYVKLGLQAAVERGFLNSTDLSKYHVGAINIGWEVTGLNNGTIEIGNFSLKQYTAQNPKSYEFNRNNNTDGWSLSSVHNNIQLSSPVLMIDTSVVKKIIIMANASFQLFWSTNSEGLFDENESIWIESKNNGEWREYILDLSNNSNWNSIVRRLRITSVDAIDFGIDYIRFAV